MRRLVVAADDRTGALETAGAIADTGLTTVMVPWPQQFGLVDLAGHLATTSVVTPATVVVVDLGSRHGEATAAAFRASSVLALPAERSAHKIDSTLRGNWAHEVGALVAAGRRVMLIPAFPAAGRTCVGGVVLEHGVAVTERHAAKDVRAPVRSSRPAEHLRLAGVATVNSLEDAAAVARWLGSGRTPSVGVCDATTDEDLASLGGAWARAGADVVLAGTAAAIGAGAAAIVPWLLRLPAPVLRVPPLLKPVLVVAGSAYPIVRAQTDLLVGAGAVVHVIDRTVPPGPVSSPGLASPKRPGSSIVVLRATEVTGTISADDALAMARNLARHAHAWLASSTFATLVIIGGDTAAAVLGDAAMAVGGTLAPGMPWCRIVVDGAATGPLIVTKPGGFGATDALFKLLAPMPSAAQPAADQLR